MKFPSKLLHKLQERQLSGSLRSLSAQNDLIDFSSNDYLGFSKNEHLFDLVMNKLKRSQAHNGSTGSRLLSGNFSFHEVLEIKLAEFFHTEAALLFNSGYDANIGLLASVPQRGDRIFYDEFSHASIRDGIRLSHANAFGFRHNDLEGLQQKIKSTNREGEVYVVVEAVYSRDGDMAPLKELSHLSEIMGFKLIVDEAHSTGVYGEKGQGMVVEQALESYVFARIHTFGKALGCHGAAITGDRTLIQYLVNFSRPFIYTTAMPLHTAVTIQFAIEMLSDAKEREMLNRNITYFKEMIAHFKLQDIFINSASPIQSAVIASPARVKEVTTKLKERNFDAKPILSPTVPLGQERIRFCVHSYNTYAEIQEILFLLSTFV